MDIQQTLVNIVGVILIVGIIRVIIIKPRSLSDVFVKLFLIDLLMKVVDEMDFDDDWDDN